MKKSISKLLFISALVLSFNINAQEEDDANKSNIQTYTPSKLLSKGQWDIKFFNNLYTETKGKYGGVKADKPRENYFTSTIEAFTGVSENNRFNIGAILEIRSNTFNGRSATSVFSFDERSGITSIAPAIKFQPIENVGNFSVQTALHIPLLKKGDEGNPNGFLDQTAWTFQNRLFYDYTFESGNWQLFTELNLEYHFGDDKSFANNTFGVTPGVFMSYFPSDKSTVLGFIQHLQRFGDFTQDYTALGFGGKYQLNKTLNLEVLYSNFVRGNDTGLGQSFNIGLRALF